MNTDHYKNILLKEQESLVESMSMLGHMTNIPGDWIVTPSEIESIKEEDSTSDRMEETLTNESILETLEIRLKEIQDALIRINNGNYGICEKCNIKIEEGKLNANPATTLCLKCDVF